MKTESQILLDECISITAFRNAVSPRIPQSIKLVGAGACDDQVLKYAINHDLYLMTNDAGLVVRSVKVGKPVIYRDIHRPKPHDFLIAAIPIEKIQLIDPLTKHLVANYDIIRP